jgi:enterochelin esterase family protein
VNFPAYLDFLRQELVPWVRQNYHVTTDPARTIVGGASLSGVTAAVAALHYPDMFGNVLSQSGWFGWKPENDTEHEWVARQFAQAPKTSVRLYLEAGSLEFDEGSRDQPSLLLSNRHLRSVLQAKGYPVYYHEYQGAHQPVVWQGTLADGLVSLIGKRVSS